MSGAPVPSPCNKVCTMDPSGAYCIGCHRTLDEIAGWGGFSDDERRAVIAKLYARSRHLAPGALARCERCGTAFPCGASEPGGACWCNAAAPVTPADPGARCLCPSCLAKAGAA